MNSLKLIRSLVYWAVRDLRKLTIVLFFLGVSASTGVAGPVVIAALGDSLTQGYGLPPEEGFVPQLETWLREQGEDVRILNAGVSGDTTAGGLSRVDWTLTPEVEAMIVALGGNDVLRGVDPANSRANIDGILKAAADRDLPVLLVGIAAPGNYGAEYQRDFDAIYPELAEEYGALLHPNFLAALARNGSPMSPDPQFFQSDNLHPNAEGVQRIVRSIGPKVQELIARVAK